MLAHSALQGIMCDPKSPTATMIVRVAEAKLMHTGVSVELPYDVWVGHIYCADYTTAHRARLINKTAREAVERDVICQRFGVIVNSASRSATQGVLQATFCLTAQEARKLPHEEHAIGPYGVAHIFDLDAVYRILQRTLGPAELRARIATRDSRKRKRDESEATLPARKAAAAEKRAVSLGKAIKAAGLGADLATWADQLTSRSDDGFRPLSNDDVLKAYLSDSTLKPVYTLQQAMDSVRAIETRYSATRIAERAAVAAAKEGRHAELRAALDALGLTRRADSAICDAFERGEPIAEFNTASMVAAEMAKMHWLHSYTDYERALERCVRNLRDEAGHFYAGINREASDIVKARRKFQPPERWPWL